MIDRILKRGVAGQIINYLLSIPGKMHRSFHAGFFEGASQEKRISHVVFSYKKP